MRISLELPDGFIQVEDTENYKGVPVTVLRVLGEECLFYHGRSAREFGTLDNETWEGIFRMRLATFLGEMFMGHKSIAEDWQTENPTGRELRSSGTVEYVREN